MPHQKFTRKLVHLLSKFKSNLDSETNSREAIYWPKIKLAFFIRYFIFSDSLHGRRICRAFWDYYKVTGTIDDSIYLQTLNQLDSETQGPGEAEFSMLRLKDIARQRELFSGKAIVNLIVAHNFKHKGRSF